MTNDVVFQQILAQLRARIEELEARVRRLEHPVQHP